MYEGMIAGFKSDTDFRDRFQSPQGLYELNIASALTLMCFVGDVIDEHQATRSGVLLVEDKPRY